ncbi:MAG: hypothetical protein AMXMBFR78_33200 [Rubrivivax sp.]|nr:hypothetical protein [Rubrivivax sp.]
MSEDSTGRRLRALLMPLLMPLLAPLTPLAPRLAAMLMPLLLPLLLVGCGGGAEPRPSEAAFALAEQVGRSPQLAERDLSVLMRKRGLQSQDAVQVRRAALELFEAGERDFAQFFPSRQPDQLAGPFAFRYYPETAAFLVVDQVALQVYVIGGPFGEAVTFVGDVIDFVKCVNVSVGYPEAQFDLPGGGDGPGGSDGPGSDGGVGGTSADGAIRNADVRLYDGRGLLLGQARSDDKGTVRLKACGSRTGPYRIEYRGNAQAMYFDESIVTESYQGAWRPFPASETLESYVPDLTQHATVSALTQAAVYLAEGLQAQGLANTPQRARASFVDLDGRVRTLPTVDRVRAAHARIRDLINTQFATSGLRVSDIARPPRLAYSPQSLFELGDDDRGRYAQLLIALAKAAAAYNPTLASPARAMSRQLALDLGDGVIDGRDARGAQVAAPQDQAYRPSDFAPAASEQTRGRLLTSISGNGSIAVTPAGAPCPTGRVGSCYVWADTVTLVAQPSPGARFLSWDGACAATTGPRCELRMTGDKSARARFDDGGVRSFGLSVGKVGDGYVGSVPGRIACGSTCVAAFTAGSSVTLTAEAAKGAVFSGWSGACSGAAPSCTVTMSEARTVVANFTPAAYPVGGSIFGLTASGLRLALAGSIIEPPPGARSFRFPGSLADGSPYEVTLAAQPAGQSCAVSGGKGVIAGAPVSEIVVTCSNDAFTVSGTVSGLSGTGLQLALGRGGAEHDCCLNIAAGAGSFTFPGALADGGAYEVVVWSQPGGQTCTVHNGSGVIRAASVTNVAVRCSASSYSVGGTIGGLTASGLRLALDFGSTYCCVAPGPGVTEFGFPVGLPDGAPYNVYVQSLPTGQSCSVSQGNGTIRGASVGNVRVDCWAGAAPPALEIRTYGLASASLMIRVWRNGSFPLGFYAMAPGSVVRLDTAFAYGDSYLIELVSVPNFYSCMLGDDSSGTLTGDRVVWINCTPD